MKDLLLILSTFSMLLGKEHLKPSYVSVSILSEKCAITYDFEKNQFDPSNPLCTEVISMETRRFLASSTTEYCLDENWSSTRWKFAFMIEALIKTETRTVSDVIETILNRKHKCKEDI